MNGIILKKAMAYFPSFVHLLVEMGRMSQTKPALVKAKSCKPEIDGLVQDCSVAIANALEILQSCTKLSNYSHIYGTPNRSAQAGDLRGALKIKFQCAWSG